MMSAQHGSDLYPQALRLPQHARDRLARLAVHLGASGPQVKVAQVTRRLCLLALGLARGEAGHDVAAALRLAASDPAQASVRNALAAIVTLLDSDASTMPVQSEPAANETRKAARPSTRRGHRRNLHTQALRLPQHARADLDALTTELCAAGSVVSAAEAMRGLCLLALELAIGGAGAEFSAAFCVAARDPTAEGRQQALEAIRQLVNGVPSTTPEPSPPTRRRGDSLPSTKRAA
jgi:hypothetical protein